MKSLLDNLRSKNIQPIPQQELAKHLSDPQLIDWFLDASREHYALLSWISSHFNNTALYDIGTYKGLSALALAANETNTVVSYDIENFLELRQFPKNLQFKIGNFFDDTAVVHSPFIMFDVDPHDSAIEHQLMFWLKRNNYKGMVMFDDIHLNPAMETFWNGISQEKYDLTQWGHWSGSGVVVFD